MAEIKIKKKKPIWPWILLIVIVLALLYFLFVGDDDDMTTDDATDDVEMITDEDNYNSNTNDEYDMSDDLDSSISEYSTYIDNDAKMGIDHNYSNGALLKLISATEAMASSVNVDVSADIETARANAKSVTKDPYEVDHANKIRNAGEIIVNAMKTIQTEKFPDLNNKWSKLNSSVLAIKPDDKTLNQKTEVKNFFNHAEDLLINMKNK